MGEHKSDCGPKNPHAVALRRLGGLAGGRVSTHALVDAGNPR